MIKFVIWKTALYIPALHYDELVIYLLMHKTSWKLNNEKIWISSSTANYFLMQSNKLIGKRDDDFLWIFIVNISSWPHKMYPLFYKIKTNCSIINLATFSKTCRSLPLYLPEVQTQENWIITGSKLCLPTNI